MNTFKFIILGIIYTLLLIFVVEAKAQLSFGSMECECVVKQDTIFVTEVHGADISLVVLPKEEVTRIAVFWGDRNVTREEAPIPAIFSHAYTRFPEDYRIRVQIEYVDGDVVHYTAITHTTLEVTLE